MHLHSGAYDNTRGAWLTQEGCIYQKGRKGRKVVFKCFTTTDQRSLSVAISVLMTWVRMSIFSQLSHLIFIRPLSLLPVTFILTVLLVMWVSSHRIICPYHDGRFCVSTEVMCVTFASPLMVPFLILHFLELSLTPS